MPTSRHCMFKNAIPIFVAEYHLFKVVFTLHNFRITPDETTADG